MKSLLNALQEGRLVELPDSDKGKSLEYLAHLIEAVPDLPGVPELYEAMIQREAAANTGIGLGVACPHVRAAGSGELICAVGWSPSGIDYGASDGKKVHLVVMYYIPDSQKNVYLKEVSSLAGAIRKEGGVSPLASAEDIATVRERLLDWVGAAIEANIPDAKARMIRLEARQAVAEAAPLGPGVGGLQVVRVMIISLGDGHNLVLCGSPELTAALEKENGLKPLLDQQAQFDRAGYRLVFHSSIPFDARTLYDYWAIKLAVPSPPSGAQDAGGTKGPGGNPS